MQGNAVQLAVFLGLTALVLDGTTGAVTRTLPLTTPDTTAAAIGADDDRPGAGQLATAEAATAAAVAELNALVAADWRPLVSTRRDPGAGPPAPREAITAGPLTFTFVARDRTLVVTELKIHARLLRPSRGGTSAKSARRHRKTGTRPAHTGQP